MSWTSRVIRSGTPSMGYLHRDALGRRLWRARKIGITPDCSDDRGPGSGLGWDR
jgi:hypothetical protein